MTDLTFRQTPLEKCLLAIAIPLKEDDFFHDITVDDKKDFAKRKQKKFSKCNSKKLWNDYRKIVDFVEEIKNNAEKLGVCVTTDFSIDQMNIFKNFDVVTIVAHWIKHSKKIELFDGVYSPTKFINALPAETELMLDLIICESATHLLNKIKNKHPEIITSASLIPVSIETSLLIYKFAIQEMANNKELNYLDAKSIAKRKILSIL